MDWQLNCTVEFYIKRIYKKKSAGGYLLDVY